MCGGTAEGERNGDGLGEGSRTLNGGGNGDVGRRVAFGDVGIVEGKGNARGGRVIIDKDDGGRRQGYRAGNGGDSQGFVGLVYKVVFRPKDKGGAAG